ncbi:KCNB1, partial [Symbiodinium microadriaticum]
RRAPKSRPGVVAMSVPGLEEELQAAGLERCTKAAAEWCEQMGPRDLEEIGEPDVFPEFADALSLRPLERKRLLKGIQKASGSGGYPAAVPAAAAKMPGNLGPGPAIFVKNTFLEMDNSEATAGLPRSSTTPAPASAYDDGEEGAEDDPEEDPEESEQAEALSNPIYKTMTFDAWESGNAWDWMYKQGMESQESAQAPTDPKSVESIPEETPVMSGAVGMMFVPQEVMPSYAMAVPPPEMCMPGCFAVPMDPFSRFPGAMDSMPPALDGSVSTIAVTTTADNNRAQVLQRAFSVSSNVYRIRWTVDARKLRSTDKEAVSPPFDLTFAGGQPVPFKMILRPRVVAQERGGASFRRSRGRGNIQLRCMAESDAAAKPVVTFRLLVGSEKAAKQLKPRGPVSHDFSEKNICGLPPGQDDWDFGKAVVKGNFADHSYRADEVSNLSEDVILALVPTKSYLICTSCTEPKFGSSGCIRAACYASTTLNLIDLAAIVPFYVGIMLGSESVGAVRILRLMRVLRLLKLAKHHPGITLCVEATVESGVPLAVLMFFNIIFGVIFASVIFYFEGSEFSVDDQFLQNGFPRGVFVRMDTYGNRLLTPFRSIPISLWWVFTTTTTVGYGDMAPTSHVGRAIGVLCFYTGIIFLALPIGVLSSNFEAAYARHLERKRKNAPRLLEAAIEVAEQHLLPIAPLAVKKSMFYQLSGTDREGLRRTVFKVLNDPSSSEVAKWASYFITAVILVTTVSMLLESIPELSHVPDACDSLVTVENCRPQPSQAFFQIELVCIIIFTVDYVLRICTAHAMTARELGVPWHDICRHFNLEPVGPSAERRQRLPQQQRQWR